MKEKIYFSSFRESGRLPNTLAISRTVPRWYRGERLIEASPPMKTVQRFKKNNDGQWQWFIEEYIKQIYDSLKLEEWYERSKGKILLCHCEKEHLCHRILLAKTFEIEFGAEVEEVGGWNIPFNKPFEKIETFCQWSIEDNSGNSIDVVGNYLKLKNMVENKQL